MRVRSIGVFFMAGLAAGLLAIPAQAAVASSTILVSQSTGGVQGNDMSGRFSPPAISGDGLVTAFDSVATNLVPSDTNHAADVFAHDSVSGETERVSVSTSGVQGNEDSQSPTVDQTGQHVAFDSSSDNLVANSDRNSVLDVFVRDRATDQTTLVSVTPAGKAGNASSFDASISADGRYVAFLSDASNLIAGDTNHVRDIFVRDLVAGTTERVSVASDGTPQNSDAAYPSISADGSRVAFASFATNLVPNDVNDMFDVFVRDRVAGTTVIASVANNGTQGDQSSITPAISGNGRYVAFASDATTLVRNDDNERRDVFRRDLSKNKTIRVSVTNTGAEADGQSVGPGVRGGLVWGPAISNNGARIAFDSVATNLVADDTNTCEPFFPGAGQCPDVFVRDVKAGTTVRVSVASDGSQGNDASTDPSMDLAGTSVTFFSAASNLVDSDVNFCIQFPTTGHCPDIFVHTA
jgi:Tol biopolymer transport system component